MKKTATVLVPANVVLLYKKKESSRTSMTGLYLKLFLSVILFIITITGYAADYYNVNGSANANDLTSWTTDAGGTAGTVPLDFISGDVFNIRTGTTLNTNAAWTVTGSIVISGTLTLSNALIINGGFTNNGTFNNGNQTVTIGTGGDIAGTGAVTFFNLIINTVNPADIVTLSKTLLTIKGGNGSTNGRLTLNQGIFKVGAGNTVEFNNNSSENSIDNPGPTGTSNFATTGNNGEDGGSIIALQGSGANFTISGIGLTTFYDLSIGTVAGQGNRTVNQTNPNVLISGTLSLWDNQGKWRTNSPAYGNASTLFRNNNGQQYRPGENDTKEWLSLASGTIGITAGYPNNVIIVNVGNSASNYNGETYGVKLSGNWSINGILQAGSPAVTGFVDLGPGTNFTCGGIIIENNSRLRAPDATGSFTVNGDFLRTGATVGIFSNALGTVNFAGAGTATLPQIITASDGSVTLFGNLMVSDGTYVKLNSPVTLPAGILTLTAGIIETSSANLLSVNNTAVDAISGGGPATFINGPLRWSLLPGTTSTYHFPLGKGTTYLPFTLVPNSTSTNIATAEAFDTNSGGTPDGITLTSLSNTEYWSLSTTGAFTTGANISVTRPAAISPNNGLGKSTTANGIYSSIGGTPGIFSVTNSVSIGTTSPWFFALGVAPLAVQVINITTPSCVGTTGTITVAGTGGNPPYTYQLGSGPFSGNAVFPGLTPGTYTITVTDGTTPVADTATVTAVVLSPVRTNNDTTICPGRSVNLSAEGTGTNYSWSPSVGLNATNIANPVATPTATTTYIVTADIISDLTPNLVSNPGFDAGNTGFESDYQYITSQNTNTGLHKFYGIAFDAENISSFFGPNGCKAHGNTGLMFVADGSTQSSGDKIWGVGNITVTPNTTYRFSYWTQNVDKADGHTALSFLPILETQINGQPITGSVISSRDTLSSNACEWVQITYIWNSGANTSASIGLYDINTEAVGNDFALDDMEFRSSCQVTDSVTITVSNGTAAAPVTAPVTYCQNAMAVPLTATGTGLLWYAAATGGQPLPGAPTPSTAMVGDTVFYVSQTIAGGCSGESPRASLTVTITTGTAAPVTSPVTYCQNAAATALTATGNGLLWYTAATGGQLLPAAPIPVTTTAGVTTYYVSQTGSCGEGPRAALIVTVNPATAEPGTTPVNYCQNATATPVTATGTGLIWYSSVTGGQPFAAAPIPSTATAGNITYYVSQTGTCGESLRAALTVTVTALPTVDAGSPQTITAGNSVTIDATASVGTYLWSPATGLSATTVLNPVASPAQTTPYTLTVTNNGCSASDDVTITVITTNCLNPPNIFTPNNDGFYDLWVIFNNQCVKQLKVDVYNRWGGLVFHSENYDNKWDGTHSGHPLPDATYYYVIKALFSDGHIESRTGNVTIMR